MMEDADVPCSERGLQQTPVGCRVQVGKERAAVRFLGSVAKQEGLWVGVEWDDATRGKHDGSTGGVKYFSCVSNEPTAASFVRVEKVNFGTNLLDALVSRYTNVTGEMGDVDKSELWVHTVQNRKVQIELVGEEMIQAQQRQIQHLPSARVVGAAVSTLGDPDELAAALPALTELDLTCNLLHSWDVAEGICNALTGLKTLNLSDNKLVLPRSVAGRASLPGLRRLVLNDCGSSWIQASVPGARAMQCEEQAAEKASCNLPRTSSSSTRCWLSLPCCLVLRIFTCAGTASACLNRPRKIS